MMSSARKALRYWTFTALIAFAALSPFAAPGVQAREDKDSIKISSTQAFLARQIGSRVAVGHFLHVQGNVTMAAATRARLKLVVDVPIVLTSRLEVDGKQLPPCGTGGQLPPAISLGFLAPEGGVPISPLFYVPAGTLENAEVLDLVIGEGPLEPLVRAPIPWTKDLVEGAGPGHVALISVATKDRPDDDEGSITSMQKFRLRFPTGLTRVLGGGNVKLYCGDKPAEGINIGVLGDVVDAWFDSPVDALNDRWVLQFPELGVELELKMSKP